jgi:hypothetical protein
MTVLPPPEAERNEDELGRALFQRLKALAHRESGGDYIVQVRVTPRNQTAQNGCQCCCG